VVFQTASGHSSPSTPPPGTEIPGSVLGHPDLNSSFRDAKERVIAEFELKYLTALLEWAGGNVSRAARKAKMDRMNLHRLVQRYGLREGRGLRD
jgi:DNA-binding NtrC family response regulator